MKIIYILLALASSCLAGQQIQGPIQETMNLNEAPAEDSSLVLTDVTPVFHRNQTVSKAHDYLGWATIAMGLATGLTAPKLAGHESHEVMGNVSALLAGSALATGFWAHYGEVGNQQSSSSSNVHALLGIIGGALMVTTPFIAPSDAHKMTGILGASLMTVAVTWKVIF